MIKSQAFGRVTLTDRDARKFENQVTYGKPSKAAVESVKRGVALSREFKKTGHLEIRLGKPRAA